VAGRTATALPFCPVPRPGVLVGLAGLVFAIFILNAIAAFAPNGAATFLPGKWGYVMPLTYLVYYFLRGFVVTLMYLRVKLLPNRAEAEAVSTMMGSLGQLGSFTAVALFFILISVLKVMPEQPDDPSSSLSC
jgi:hypothetical protein